MCTLLNTCNLRSISDNKVSDQVVLGPGELTREPKRPGRRRRREKRMKEILTKLTLIDFTEMSGESSLAPDARAIWVYL